MTGVIESLEARIKVLEERVALLEGRGQPPSTGYCPFCFGSHPGLPCPAYVVTCDSRDATSTSAGGGV